MSKPILIHVRPGGEVRTVHDDNYDFAAAHGQSVPRRASHVEPVPDGPRAGQWFVDFTPLGTEFQYCLWPTFVRRDHALAAEVKHLQESWLTTRGEEEKP